MRCCLFAAPIAVAAMIVVSPLHGQDLSARVDEVFSFATSSTPGCVVGVAQRGAPVITRAYGLADVERSVPLSANSVFDIGSVQKQFVAAAVLLLVQDGRLSLGDDSRTHLPELADYGHTVTVDHLLRAHERNP
jgi:CubicO group peptidase (beta-lactamase class C family)